MEKAVGDRRGILETAVPIGAALFVVHAIAVINDWYRLFPWIDTFIHYGWAVVLGLIVYLFIEYFPGHVDLGKNLFVTILVGLSLSALGGILWEFGEFTYDFIGKLYNPEIKPVQLGVRDTMKDMVHDLLGGLTVAIFAWLRYHKKRK